MRKRGVIGFALALVLEFAAPAVCAQDYPNRPITMVVGLAPGGITDVTSRIYAEALSKIVGQRVVVENRQGAGGAVGAAAVQNAKPDGYTLLVFSGSQHVAVPAMQATAPYDPIKGFSPITVLFDLTTIVAVPMDHPAKTLAELFAYGKKKPGGLTFGSPGVGTPSHMLAARLARASNTPVQYAHYRGGGPMMADLITGRVDFALASYTVARSNFAAKKLRGLAIDAPARWSTLPDVPTLTEVGYGNEKVANWFGIAAPARMPPALIKKLNADFIKASKDPALVKRLTENGTPIETTSPEQMAKLLAEEQARTIALVNELGLKQK